MLKRGGEIITLDFYVFQKGIYEQNNQNTSQSI